MSSKNRQALMHTSLFSDLIKDITLFTSSGLRTALYHPGYKDTAIAQTLLLLEPSSQNNTTAAGVLVGVTSHLSNIF